jgi:hypothetical protein
MIENGLGVKDLLVNAKNIPGEKTLKGGLFNV